MTGRVIGGGETNVILDGANHATIGGGTVNMAARQTPRSRGMNNLTWGEATTIAGGLDNGIGLYGEMSAIGGGQSNTVAARASAV